ncbi:EAL domain-containing protein [Vibrio alfacsensis]|uniref:EAL domain-containing protein n=1 Tax=Vibrio alfacsensis TaxID=1074311 RepID=UPI00406832D1
MTISEELLTMAGGILMDSVDQQYASLLTELPNIAFIKDDHDRFIFANYPLLDFYQITANDVIGKREIQVSVNQILTMAYPQSSVRSINNPPAVQAYKEIVSAQGKLHQFHALKVPYKSQDGRERAISIYTDIADIKSEHMKMVDQLQRLEYALDAIDEGVWDWNIQAGLITHNRKWVELIGANDGLLTHPLNTYIDAIHPDDKSDVMNALQACLSGEKALNCRYRINTSDNRLIWVNDRGDVVEHDQHGKPTRMVGAIMDITEQVKQERELRRLAYQDRLTSVFNRRYFYEQVQQLLERINEQNRHCFIITADIDNFKLVNDRFSHSSGDALLCFVAEQLSTLLQSPDDIVARLSADEFAVALFFEKENQDLYLQQIMAISEEIIANIHDYGLRVHTSNEINLSLGLYQGNPDDSLELRLHLADIALSHAKKLNLQNCVCYQEWMGERFAIRRELRSCLEQDLDKHFIVYIQPIVDQQQSIIGGEILLRWRNSAGEIVPPVKFIDELESMHKLPIVTYWLFQQVIAMVIQYQLYHLSFSINISSSHFKNAQFMAELVDLLARHPDVCNLKLEITETVMLEDFQAIRSSMDRLITHNINFSLDDFGTGFSSIESLLQLPISELKIDKSFVGNIVQEKNRSVIELILAMARNMKLSCVAEGIEQSDQLDYISKLGCDKFQGYYFSLPLPQPEFLKIISSKDILRMK